MNRKVVDQGRLGKPSLGELEVLAQKLSKNIPSSPLVILLIGDLGTGKTQWARFYLKARGVVEEVSSPSFALENLYKAPSGFIHHFDLYRLESADDVESSGLWEAFDSPCTIVVEWADRVPFDSWPWDWPILEIHFSSDHSLTWRHTAHWMK